MKAGVSITFSLNVENERADAGRDGRTRLARPDSQQERTGTGKYHFPCSADQEKDRQPYRLMLPSLLNVI